MNSLINMEDEFRFEEVEPQRANFADLHRLLWDANSDNRNNGFVLKTTTYSAEQLQEYLGNDGRCFEVYYLNQLIASLSVRFIYKKKWYINGKVSEYCLAGVLHEYRGEHILSTLSDMAFRFASTVCTSMILSTADRNKHAISIYEHYGFVPIDFIANPGGDHYSVIMMKWFDKCPLNKFYITFRYIIKKIYVIIRYLPSKRKRFGI